MRRASDGVVDADDVAGVSRVCIVVLLRRIPAERVCPSIGFWVAFPL